MDYFEIARLEMMRKRHAYFSAVAEEYTSFADFIKAHGMWLTIMGIELTDCGQYLKLYIQLSPAEYEEYYVIMDKDGQLNISDIVMWNDNVGCASYLDICTGQLADKESILGY